TVSTKLYVGRVWNTLTEQDIFDALDAEAKKVSPLAKVERVFIPKPHRGFAFVTVNDPNVTKRFCQIRDFLIRGKSVCVSLPTPKSNTQILTSPQQHHQQQQQQQQQLQFPGIYPSRFQMPQQAPSQTYPAQTSYVSNQYPQQHQQQNWMSPRSNPSSYRQQQQPVSSHMAFAQQ
ncbi:unnamed protein product, partial [Gongylonema pulchrum]|uniref:RRM domain-containing protein n=1 Tax=Gongylonema pulchrum TaxID=637853 RepID=A0A183DEL8_9BILA